MVNGSPAALCHWRWKMKATVETNAAIPSQPRFSAAAKAAMKQDELNITANALENLTHALKFR
ncbi:hypothetical protein IE4803_PA00396 (plasmid) [Rhizobium etli bv. phaseoli str. IE4803]|uniref:Uncharacterized protein n=1 Tax=Rhizobium etli bv. mimosae str. IE4771 TaxID=1432050 RepID=A0A060I697_RHIET|nr:hypothetical protein IE4771_PC00409 [Rhizobium sp. IE4771]AJC82039.1 hypothetical protein IE4803_PA00396 [Rhizobium etli bv. phaseoli str. IE4803]